MRSPFAIAAASIAAVATAQHGAYEHHGMPQFSNPFPRTTTGSDLHLSPRKPSTVDKSVGARVGPGRVLTKAERLQRKADRVDSIFGGMDGQADDPLNYDVEHNWAAFKAKWAADPWWSRAFDQFGWDIEHNFAPGKATCSFRDLRTGQRIHSLRSLICLAILFVLVFGTLYTLLEYLLSATRASACSVTTVYIPVTYTVTSAMSSVSPLAASNDTSPSLTYTATTTHTSMLMETLTSFLTLSSEASAAAPASSNGSPSYVYTTNSVGSTEWINGVSPSSGASFTIMTTTVVMRPVAPTDSALTMQSTATETTTITPPAYTSTVYSFQSPDLTSTSTSTHYVTYTVSTAELAASMRPARSSFAGVSSSGWNASVSTHAPQAPNNEADADPITTTMTAVSYIGNGDDTTSTRTTLITTTVALQYTTTVYPAAQSSSGSPYITTITALPVTINPGGSSSPLDTASSGSAGSVPLVSGMSIASSVVYNSSAYSSGGVTTTLSSALPLVASSQSSLSANSSALSSGVAASSTGQAPPSSASLSIVSSTTSANVSQSAAHSVNGTASSNAITATQSSSALKSSSSLSTITGSFISAAQVSMTTSESQVSGKGPSSAKSQTSQLHGSTPPAMSSIGSSGAPVSGNSSTAHVPATASHRSRNVTIISTHSMYPAGASQSPARNVSSTVSLANSFTSKKTKTKGTPLTAASRTSSSLSGLTTSERSSKTNLSFGPPSITASSSLITSSSASHITSTKVVNSTNPFPASSATATPTAGCGEHGDFMLTFDDLPNFLPTNENDKTITQAPPIPRPYHHLTFSDGYVYAPEPSEPYQPASAPHLAVFLANATGRVSSFRGKPGEVGDGPGRDAVSAFWFDAYNGYFGCDNTGTNVCTLVFKAYTWDPTANAEILTYKQNATIPPCKTMTDLNCQLQKVAFPPSFRNLTGLQIQAYTGKAQRMFFMDDLALHWSNNSCAAGLLRQSSQ